MNMPIVIGSGVSGLAVSRQLSQCQIPHYLIGEPLPTSRPQLGESMDAVCSLEMLEKWGNFHQSFYQKDKVIFYTDGWVTTCPFNFERQPKLAFFFKALGFRLPAGLLHVDRAEFDRPFFQETIALPLCHYQAGRVKSLDYDSATDSISEVYLENGETLKVSYVFDCSNHVRVLAQSLNLPVQLLGKRQRVVFTHLGTERNLPKDKTWIYATNLIKLERSLDGVEGLGWCIPLGQHVSIGISCDLEEAEAFSERELLELFLQASVRQGLDITSIYDQQFPLVSIQNTYYWHERVRGANWLLSGPTACQIWFSSGSAVGFALFAACLADQFLQGSTRAIKLYENYLISLKKSHEVIDRIRYQKMDSQLMQQLTNQIFFGNGVRLCTYAEARGTWLRRTASWLLKDRLAVLAGSSPFCRAYPIETELEPTWQPLDERQAVVSQVMQMVSGKTDIAFARQLIARQLLIEISGSKACGIQFWYLWLKAAQWLCPYREFQLCPTHMESGEDYVKTTAEFRASDRGTLIRSNSFTVIHKVRQGKVTEIATKWENYQFLFGSIVTSKLMRYVLALSLGLVAHLVRSQNLHPESVSESLK
jgi:flavin-dependent dehydrogenase